MYPNPHPAPRNPRPQAFKGYEAASDAGHWKAPIRLAQMHARGRGTSTNCTKAARLFLVFLEEQSGWTQDSDAAMQALDDKDDWGALVLPLSLPPSLPTGSVPLSAHAAPLVPV